MGTDRGSRPPGAGSPGRQGAHPMIRPWQRFAARGALALFGAAVVVEVYQGALSAALLTSFLLAYAWWQFRRLKLS